MRPVVLTAAPRREPRTPPTWARTCPLTRRAGHSRLASQHHNRTHIPPSNSEGATLGREYQCNGNGCAQARDPVGSRTDLALAERRACEAFPIDPWCRPASLGRVSPLDRAQVEPSPCSRLQAGPPLGFSPVTGRWVDCSSRTLALYSSRRGRLERGHRQRVLRRPADDVRLGWPGRQCRVVVAEGSDAGGGDRISEIRLFDGVAGRAVAEYVTAMSSLRLSSP